MANEPYTITNQKLYFSKLAIFDWQQKTSDNSSSISILKAYQQQTIFHLYTVVWAIYNEVAGYYRIPLLNADVSLKKWLTDEFIAQYPSAELNELYSLLNTDSFIATIISSWEKIFNPLTVEKQSTITLIGIGSEVDHCDQAREILAQLNNLVLRFRAGLSEY